LLGYTELTAKIDIKLISRLVKMVADRIEILNLMNAKDSVSSKELLNTAIESVVFDFTKIGEEELRLVSEDMHNTATKVRHELDKNFNKKDPEWISLYEAFVELLNKHHINPNAESLENMRFESQELKAIFDKIRELNRKNSVLLEKFNGDRKFAIIFKKQQPTGRVSDNLPLYNLLNDAKSRIDGRLRYNQHMLDSEGYFRRVAGADVLESFETGQYDINSHIASQLTRLVADEYIEEFKGEN
jgi:type I restriction enzyme R subunit